jgi:membrane complex biogenesis BtpA family protein
VSTLSTFRQRFGRSPVLIGMVHVGALPGTPAVRQPLDEIVGLALAEARIYRDEGFTAIGVENMHDRPYLKGAVGPEIVAAMTVVVREVKREAALPVGVQVLAGANREALAIAHAASADFIRVEGFVFAHVADEGLIDGCAGELLRYRRAIDAGGVLIFADIKKKHAAHALTGDVSLAETAHAAEFFLADGVIVTGPATGVETSPDDLRAVLEVAAGPVLVGSGLTDTNLARYRGAHGFIVGSSLKTGGLWSNPIDRDAVRRLAKAFHALGDGS